MRRGAAQRVRNAQVAPEPLGRAGTRRRRREEHAAIVAPEVVRALAQADGHAAEVVRPGHRQPRAHQPVASHRFVRGVVESHLPRPAPHAPPLLPVVQHVPVVRPAARIEHQAARPTSAGEPDALDGGLTGRHGVDRVAVADLDRHPAIAQPLDGDRGAPPAPLQPAALDSLQPVVDQRRRMQPLAKERAEIAPRHLLAHRAKRRLVQRSSS